MAEGHIYQIYLDMLAVLKIGPKTQLVSVKQELLVRDTDTILITYMFTGVRIFHLSNIQPSCEIKNKRSPNL